MDSTGDEEAPTDVEVTGGQSVQLVRDLTLALAIFLGGVAALDLYSRMAPGSAWAPRSGMVGAAACGVLALVVAVGAWWAARRSVEGEPGIPGAMAPAFLGVAALCAASFYLRTRYWETGIGTPFRAVLPTIVAWVIVLVARSSWLNRAGDGA